MKFVVSTQLAAFLSDAQIQKNISALLKYILLVVVVVAVYSVLFHFIMLYEGQRHSWVTGVYWTLVTMSTLGYGDFTFQSDLGRLFSIIVLLSGIVMLLIVLPFAFIRFFYAPWLEAQIKLRAPRRVPEGTRDHVIITNYDTIAPGLVTKLGFQNIPYCVIVPDAAEAARFHGDGVQVIFGDIDSHDTYVAARADTARLVFANISDTVNTNITLTVREVSPTVQIAATVESEDSIDILELAGASTVLPLKRYLGEYLANRINAGKAESHIIGFYRSLCVAEFPVHNTPLTGRSIRDTRLRETTGLSIVGVWQKGELVAARPDVVLTDHSVPVVVGTREQIDELDALLAIYDTNPNPVIVIGGGKVGRAATRALKRKGVAVNIVEKKDVLLPKLEGLPDQLFLGDAADRSVLMAAGLAEAPSVILTTNDDAVNIYLAVYCRRLNPELRIVSRITHERNIEAIHRAGADFVLSYASLGVGSVSSILQGREILILGEGVDFFYVPLPESLEGMTLSESGIGARTGLSVVAIQSNGQIVNNPTASTLLEADSELLMIGSSSQRRHFSEEYT